METNHQEAPPAPYSSENSWFNPMHQISDVFSLQPFDQPVVLLDSNRDESINYFTGNSQQYQNDQNGLVRSVMEITEQAAWQRIRWTDEMVRVLITAVSYVGESDGPQLPIKGKWRAISNTLVERGFIVSPQQCEDKFNDLNKKYKRLNDLLGRGSWCDVVGDPTMIEMMGISDEAKEEVKKILTCKQLFYLEMCSFHNKNRKYLPHDVVIQHSVRSGLRGKVNCGPRPVILDKPAKRRKNEKKIIDLISVEGVGVGGAVDLNQEIISPSVELEGKKMQIEKEMLELEKRKFDWVKFCEEEDRELHKMKMENELIKIENKRLAFELKCRERGNASSCLN